MPRRRSLPINQIGTLYLLQYQGDWAPHCGHFTWLHYARHRVTLDTLVKYGLVDKTVKEPGVHNLRRSCHYHINDAGVAVLADLKEKKDPDYLYVVGAIEADMIRFRKVE